MSADLEVLNYELSNALTAGDPLRVRELLAAGADVNAQDLFGRMPLYLAVCGGHAEVVSLLLAAGAEVNAQDSKGYTALHAAAEFGHIGLISLLLHAGVNLNAKNDEGWTALSCAAVRGHAEVALLLLAVGAELNAKDHCGFTALHCAVYWFQAKGVKALLDSGADASLRNEYGYTALAVARINELSEIVELFDRHAAQEARRLPWMQAVVVMATGMAATTSMAGAGSGVETAPVPSGLGKLFRKVALALSSVMPGVSTAPTVEASPLLACVLRDNIRMTINPAETTPSAGAAAGAGGPVTEVPNNRQIVSEYAGMVAGFL